MLSAPSSSTIDPEKAFQITGLQTLPRLPKWGNCPRHLLSPATLDPGSPPWTFLCKDCFRSWECPSLLFPSDSFLFSFKKNQPVLKPGRETLWCHHSQCPNSGPFHQGPQFCQWPHSHLPLHQTCAAPKQGLGLVPSGPASGWVEVVLCGRKKLPLTSLEGGGNLLFWVRL